MYHALPQVYRALYYGKIETLTSYIYIYISCVRESCNNTIGMFLLISLRVSQNMSLKDNPLQIRRFSVDVTAGVPTDI